jgi:hypothetical protein
MKKIIMNIFLGILIIPSVVAQQNNPYDAEGIKVKQQAVYMIGEARAGKVSTFDKKSVDKYKTELNIDNQVPVDQITAQTYQVITNSDFDAVSFINNSNLKQTVKAEVLSICKAAKNLSSFKAAVTSKVSQINQNEDLDGSDKIAILKLYAIAFHASEIFTDSGMSSNFLNSSPSSYPLALGGMAAGFAVGSLICGPTCGAVGALVGLVIGAMFDNK